jgi:hypothetical protein
MKLSQNSGRKDLHILFTKKEINCRPTVIRSGITLLNTGYKLFSYILYEQLQLYVEKIVRNYHCGFAVGVSDTVNGADSTKTPEYGVSTFHLFM